MKTAQDRQKSYADRRRKDLEFEVEDKIFIKVSPLRKVVRFDKFENLMPRFVGSFRVLERIRKLAYRVELPDRLAEVHNVFHVSQLRNFLHDTAIRVEPNSWGN